MPQTVGQVECMANLPRAQEALWNGAQHIIHYVLEFGLHSRLRQPINIDSKCHFLSGSSKLYGECSPHQCVVGIKLLITCNSLRHDQSVTDPEFAKQTARLLDSALFSLKLLLDKIVDAKNTNQKVFNRCMGGCNQVPNDLLVFTGHDTTDHGHLIPWLKRQCPHLHSYLVLKVLTEPVFLGIWDAVCKNIGGNHKQALHISSLPLVFQEQHIADYQRGATLRDYLWLNRLELFQRPSYQKP